MTSSMAVASMVTAPLQAAAQDANAPDAGYSQGSGEDPPGRVGRLALMEGTVSYHASGDDHWSPATLNAPVSSGDAYWTEPQALAKIEMTASTVWMDASTEFDLTTLDDTSMHASTPQGELYLHLKSLQPSETFTLETPRGTVTMAVDGRYDVVAGDTDHPTTVTVLDGAAQITGNNISLQVHASQTASITGATTFEGSVGPLNQDDFTAEMVRREAPVQSTGAPPIVAQMTGGEDLGQYGLWQDNSDYGQVWYPQVDSGWAPYREGRWSYVEPWGWTWVDAAPWGFAPFHYGRWVQIGPRWGWTPGYAGYAGGGRPYYAPALVGFFGIGIGVGIGIGLAGGFGDGYGRGNIGWVPLGPREAYYPNYRVSRNYLTRVNVTNIRNVTNIYNEAGARRNLAIDRYQNSRAATVVPARAMQESRPIAGAYRRPTAAELSGAHGFVDRAPIAPGARTAGLTPRAAAQLHVADFKPRQAPGPQVAPGAEHAGRGNLPALRPARGGEAARPEIAPGPALRGQQGEPQGNGGLPGLRTPGARPDVPPGETRRAPDASGHAPGPQIDHSTEAGRPGLRAPGTTPTGANHPFAPTGSERRQPASETQHQPGEHERATTQHEPVHQPASEPRVQHQAPVQHTPTVTHTAPVEHHAAPQPREPAVQHENFQRPPAAQPRPQMQARPQMTMQPRPQMSAPHASPQAPHAEPEPHKPPQH